MRQSGVFTTVSTPLRVVCGPFAKSSYRFVHYSFDLHYRRSTGRWECVQYFDSNHDHTQFHVVDDDVSAAYGYSVH